MIFVTHDQQEALALGDRVAVMRKGSVQQIGPPQEIYDRPANHFVASFIGSPAMNLIHGTVAQREGHLVFLGAETALEAPLPQFVLPIGGARAAWFGSNIGRQVLLGLRPENISVAPPDPDPKPMPALVQTVQFRGAEMICHLLVGGRSLVLRTSPNPALRPGQPVALSFDFKYAHGFDAATGAAIF